MKRQTSCWASRAACSSAHAAALLLLAILFSAPDARADGLKDAAFLSPGDARFSIMHEAPDAKVGLDAKSETRTADDPVKVKRAGVTSGSDDKADDDDDDNAAVNAQDNGGGEFHRWGFSLHAGASIPHPDFSDTFRPGPNFGVDLEYRFNKYFSVEGIYTFHRFGGERLGPFGPGNVFIEIDDLNLHQFSVNGKVYAAGGNSPFRPFFNFGGGAYKFDPGEFRGGVNVGGGLQFDVTEKMAVEGGYNFHVVFGIFDEAKFSTVQGGVRFRF